MSKLIEVKIPDIGDFKDIPVIEVLVKPGDTVDKEDSLVTLESDKATMDIPAPAAGVVKTMSLKPGDKVSKGTLILTLEESSAGAAAPAAAKPAPATAAPAAAAAPATAKPAAAPTAAAPGTDISGIKADIHAEVVVLGAGPGGYTAAFRAADLGKKVVLIERYPTLGGVCLNVGCIPSKALLHMAKVITEADEAAHAGITFGKPKIEIDKLRTWKDSVIGKLTKGLGGLAKQRKVQVITGRGEFASANTIRVETPDGVKTVAFENCIIAAGSSVAKIPGFPYDDPRIIDSTGALKLAEVPKRLLVIGGGIIGLEMATVYDALGSRITVVELMDALIPGADKDIVRPLAKRIEKRYEKILLKTKVAKIEAQKSGLKVTFEGPDGSTTDTFDAALMAVGRRPNGREIKAEAAGVTVNERGYVPVDKQQRTNVAHIYAIGDICGEPMLAHKATHEAKIAAEVIAGHKAFFDAKTIPSVAYTDPEIAWMGLTETQAKDQGIEYDKAVFPWAASGRALATGRDEGVTKALFDKNTRRLLGAAMVGVNAGELIAEAVLALEMGADATDIGLTIHPHPTLSETLFFAAEMAEGSITDLYVPKK
ncbi:MAG: dihydrolipoyl dehydrogenase [Betaproteobacteria bacterium]|nr:dihydrolipoyl dehydrogenase [Betaproteobacteria bacterium]MDH5341528.1 dihydrolipoyl dehydrogenase [Betaproteobacteria bacterium]